MCQASAVRQQTCCITPRIEPQSITYAAGRIAIDLDKAVSISEVGSSVNVIDPERGLEIIVVHADPGRYAVLSGLCTHFPRPLTYVPTRRVLQCNNFNHSIFSLNGEVVKGPAPLPLRNYAVTLRGRSLHIEL
jgi:Rieske Fe-S protein